MSRGPVPHRRSALAVGALAVAPSAVAGAVGLATGALALADELNDRLPFGSPVLGAVALLVVVAVPFLVVTVTAWRGAPDVGRFAVLEASC